MVRADLASSLHMRHNSGRFTVCAKDPPATASDLLLRVLSRPRLTRHVALFCRHPSWGGSTRLNSAREPVSARRITHGM